MSIRFWISVVCGALGFAACVWAAADATAVLGFLKENGKSTDVWLAKSVVIADFTCDGTPDVLIRGMRGRDAIVALVPSAKDGAFGEPDIVEPYVPDMKNFRVVSEEQSCDGDGEPFEGCKLKRGCWNFRVERGDIDSLHCWWDQRHRRVDCWSR